ncbi:MAG: nucleotidyl transferase AbiEii/AbiGii toxin family protein [Candidatus Omnitrophota bacterium]|nr:nucleotidyl transferase AbiEii/AbiGii toxin family protein [Candidatus Omnitrophota bacterium]
MDILQKHEILEIETLDSMNSGKFLDPLVFGGGTMLRLCYELNRYSVDLNFWFVKKTDPGAYFEKLKKHLEQRYELTDAKLTYYTILLELRVKGYPKKLKIEIRKEMKPCDIEERIAFSKFASKQVILKVHTLEQMMKNKIEAALERHEIRDFYDMEFMARKGVAIKASRGDSEKLLKLMSSFKAADFSVTLGSLLEPDARRYYMSNKFSFLREKILARY